MIFHSFPFQIIVGISLFS